jgi:small basic protein (TIGR04137 family)
MSLHPSLKIDTAGAKQRTVLSRIERIKELMKKDLWKDGQKVTALPKTKVLKVKAKKTKVKKEETPEAEAKGKKA